MNSFLKSKNDSFESNDFWLLSDFEKYKYPFVDIYQVEHLPDKENFYRPVLKAILPTDNPNKWIVKLAFINNDEKTNEFKTRVIYNIIAHVIDEKVFFGKYQDYALESWKKVQRGAITYYISPKKEINETEVLQQQNDIDKLCDFFNSKPFPLTYISCTSPVELFEVKGFDFNPMMFVSKYGGLVEENSVILSGNNSEIYTHEMVHIYTQNLFPNKHYFFDEALATYLAGSGINDYSWHKAKFRKFMLQNSDFQVEKYMDDLYEKLFYEEETSIPYLIAAVVCERILRDYGKEKYFEILKSTDDLWTSLAKVGLNKENINDVIRKELKI